MKKVCSDWKSLLPAGIAGPHLFDEFQTRATTVAGEVIRVKSPAEAAAAVAGLVQSINAKKIVAVNCPLQQAAGLHEELKKLGIELYTTKEDIAVHAESADMGISGVEFGIAETGSVLQDAYAVEGRLVATLTPIHVVFLSSSHIIPGVKEAFDIMAGVFHQGYLSFITGPSRTADIERVLTIGVHGPSRFVIIAVDEQPAGGAA